MSDCSRYWEHADHIPLNDVISYWCELSGHDQAHCREAKKAAICSAIDRGTVKFRRQDGKSYQDDIYDLAARGQLLIEKDSFNEWVKQFADAPTLEKPLGTREKDTLLKILIGMAMKGYGFDPAAARSQTPKEITDDMAKLGLIVTDDTVRKYLKQAADTVLPAKPVLP